jgi:predicted Zn finger-like uncharacterized protein
VIVSCPNCAARYKLSEAVLARGARLKCAACDHRWVPEAPVAVPAPPPVATPRPRQTEADEEAAFAAVQEQISARWADAAAPVAAPVIAPLAEAQPVSAAAPAAPVAADHQADDDSDDSDGDPGADAPPRPALLRNLVAGLAGLALSIIAAGLWVGRVDVTALPYAGPLLAQLSPPAPLAISVTGTTTVLPSGRLLLEVKGIIRNTGTTSADVPDLRATLSGPAGMALRWTIMPRVRRLPAGTETEYSSTVTGFPPEARSVAITPARQRLF